MGPDRSAEPGGRSAEVLAGVDACRAGWVVALAGGTGSGGGAFDDVEVQVAATFAEVLGLGAATVAVDIPIGLPDAVPRVCDVAARRLLGPRRSSVFPAPVRAALDAHRRGWEATLCASRAAAGTGLSRQAFHLLPKVAEVDDALEALDAGTPTRVVEAHPELAFARLAGGPLPHPKRVPEGRAHRAALLRPVVPQVDDLLRSRPRGCAADDLLDALALLGTAHRLRAGAADLLGDGSTDRRGRPVQIAW
jgi:predicted RNase H-like nuclease